MHQIEVKLWPKSNTLPLQRVKGKKQMLSIFIISNHLMFSRGLESLLAKDVELRVIGQETDVEQALKQIKQLQPDVVIIYEDPQRGIPASIIFEIFTLNPGGKVISLNLQNNIFYVYQAVQQIAREPEDLLKAIKVTSSSTVQREWGNALNRQVN
jgi:DNA-binding NarL/FixJ family response regulator